MPELEPEFCWQPLLSNYSLPIGDLFYHHQIEFILFPSLLVLVYDS
jgi:hypothetical protein